ncbi:uncharacterized protein MONBRDRAFT_32330 [Monosiga brevicollis MX1]|uniref:Adenylate kinase n=1 Tax=Monosiga brevicollis TaxID=81824 RepID=A9UYU6_MONBE|nr:uncharacterized protein MONBRDRAFT_32330 [Monosiga brevicollis MX1]EDQ89523.1 predicted protein [Monosiga brevicollis MX1]|eukprot:XP_001745552.1 hypothetical protein [Monosiga brevicollis MX1]
MKLVSLLHQARFSARLSSIAVAPTGSRLTSPSALGWLSRCQALGSNSRRTWASDAKAAEVTVADAPQEDGANGKVEVGGKAVRRGTTSQGPDVHDSPDIARSIFDAVWRRLEREHGRANLRFPSTIVYLNGAPGSGKGTMAKYFVNELHLNHIATSSLLQTPEAQKMKSTSMLVNDSDVEVIKQLQQRMAELHREFFHTDLATHFPRPKFHVVMLYIGEEESVKRQMKRGEQVEEHNARVEASGEGRKVENRTTDIDETLARKRYRIFREEGYEPIRTLRSLFNYHFIAADGSIEEVRARVMREFAYQSSLELSDATFARLQTLPSAESISLHFRANLVKELDQYEARSPELVDECITIIQRDFLPQIRLCQSSGRAVVKSYHDIFQERTRALRIVVAILAERGFEVSVRRDEVHIPREVDEHNRILNYTRKYVLFDIMFPKAKI